MKFGAITACIKQSQREVDALCLVGIARDFLKAHGEVVEDGYTPHVIAQCGDLTFVRHAWQNRVPTGGTRPAWDLDDDDRHYRFAVEIRIKERLVLRVVCSDFSGNVLEVFRRGAAWEKQVRGVAAEVPSNRKPSAKIIDPQRVDVDDEQDGGDDVDDFED